ncbi:hypothetical protein VUR80DRAFT_9323 [Thermomyces stellatus]
MAVAPRLRRPARSLTRRLAMGVGPGVPGRWACRQSTCTAQLTGAALARNYLVSWMRQDVCWFTRCVAVYTYIPPRAPSMSPPGGLPRITASLPPVACSFLPHRIGFSSPSSCDLPPSIQQSIPLRGVCLVTLEVPKSALLRKLLTQNIVPSCRRISNAASRPRPPAARRPQRLSD